jgi:hypothetical protein
MTMRKNGGHVSALVLGAVAGILSVGAIAAPAMAAMSPEATQTHFAKAMQASETSGLLAFGHRPDSRHKDGCKTECKDGAECKDKDKCKSKDSCKAKDKCKSKDSCKSEHKKDSCSSKDGCSAKS